MRYETIGMQYVPVKVFEDKSVTRTKRLIQRHRQKYAGSRWICEFLGFAMQGAI